jgi:hypothetical protein
MRSLFTVVPPLLRDLKSQGFPPSEVTGITQIANRDRAKRRNLQFCDPGHLHPRQAVRRCIEGNGDGHEGILGASAGADARSWRCGGSSCGGSFADSGAGR